jgi:hypothetical protein
MKTKNVAMEFAQDYDDISHWRERKAMNAQEIIGSLTSKQKIIDAALSLLPSHGDIITPQEKKLITVATGQLSKKETSNLRLLIRNGNDPLGNAYCALLAPDERRKAGAVYTPLNIVDSMLLWARAQKPVPKRIIDAGTGSGRFILKAGKMYRKALLIGIECDPVAALILRANAASLGLLSRLQVLVNDYRSINLPDIKGTTLFIGNPPYTRHHDIPTLWKDWFSELLLNYDSPSSKLAGLHIHFFAKTLQLAKKGDYGAFITSSEWLDVNYGKILRHLLTNGLGGLALHVLSPESLPFTDTQTTGTITCFRVGNPQEAIKFKKVNSIRQLGDLSIGGHYVSKLLLQKSSRWSIFTKRSRPLITGTVKLGDLFDVHRGQVTGCNRVFINGNYEGDIPKSMLYPTITKGEDLFNCGPILTTADGFKQVIDIPTDISLLTEAERSAVDKFIVWAIDQKANESYIAKHREPWWAVRLYKPAPILCTYMARRPPRFAHNLCNVRHINVVHGLYPTTLLTEEELNLIVDWLNCNVSIGLGRTYAGGLTKFEPGEVMNILMPHIDVLKEEVAI